MSAAVAGPAIKLIRPLASEKKKNDQQAAFSMVLAVRDDPSPKLKQPKITVLSLRVQEGTPSP
jgi:hypothetical protein